VAVKYTNKEQVMSTATLPAFATKIDLRRRQPVQGPAMAIEDIQRLEDEYRASRKFVGLTTVDFNGNVFEWLSWERMMSE